MNIKTIAILLPCWLILLCLSGCGHKPYTRQYKIALVHSYEEGYPDAERTRRLLCEALAKRGLSCDFREYFLPFVVDELLKADLAQVTVLKSVDRWYGVTYKEDKETVVKAIKDLKDKGLYPEKLWEELVK